MVAAARGTRKPIAIVAFFAVLRAVAALLSRTVARIVVAALTCVVAVALGAGLAAWLGAPFRGALVAATAASAVTAVVIVVALELGDRKLFASRAPYKPTIEQLSGELTSITSPDAVASAVERTVSRWLPCEEVAFLPLRRNSTAPPPPSDAVQSGQHPKVSASDCLEMPVRFQGLELGALRVGRKRGGALFTTEDIDLLRTITNQAALALAYANAYAEVERRRRDQAAAWREERSALVETVAAEIAHEVRYPLNFFRSVFRRGSTGQLDAEDVDIGCEEVARLERLVSGLRRVAQHTLERRAVSVRELALKAEMLLRDELGPRKLSLDVAPDDAIRCDVDQITQVLVNLLSNALDAAGRDGSVGIAWSADSGGGSLVVWDSGEGFVGDPARVFIPWVTTKPGGRGLGLAITQRIVRAHNWRIDADRNAGRTCFVVSVSRADIVTSRDDSEAVA